MEIIRSIYKAEFEKKISKKLEEGWTCMGFSSTVSDGCVGYDALFWKNVYEETIQKSDTFLKNVKPVRVV